MTEAAQAPQPDAQRPVYGRSVLFAVVAFLLCLLAFGISIANERSDAAYWFAASIFLLVAPALHIAGIVRAVYFIRQGYSLWRGMGALLLHVVLIGLGVLFGGIALIGASA